jgi:hypothetical protein
VVRSCKVDVGAQLAEVQLHHGVLTASGANKYWELAALQEAGAQGDGLEAVQCTCHSGYRTCILVPAAPGSQ